MRWNHSDKWVRSAMSPFTFTCSDWSLLPVLSMSIFLATAQKPTSRKFRGFYGRCSGFAPKNRQSGRIAVSSAPITSEISRIQTFCTNSLYLYQSPEPRLASRLVTVPVGVGQVCRTFSWPLGFKNFTSAVAILQVGRTFFSPVQAIANSECSARRPEQSQYRKFRFFQ